MAKIVITHHAIERFLDRGIEVIDVRKIIKKPLKVYEGLNDTIMVEGLIEEDRILWVVYKKLKGKIIVITSYYGN